MIDDTASHLLCYQKLFSSYCLTLLLLLFLPFFFCFYLSDPVDSIGSTSFIHGIPTYLYIQYLGGSALHQGRGGNSEGACFFFSLHGVYNCINWFLLSGFRLLGGISGLGVLVGASVYE